LTELRAPASAAADSLRQLWLACSTYRLYPGDPTQAAFVAAVERVEQAVARACVLGAVEVEVRGGRFHVDGKALPDDEVLLSFADRCFKRGVEYLLLERPPSAGDLVVLSDALLRPDQDTTDDPATLLESHGVSSVRLARVDLAAVADVGQSPMRRDLLAGRFVDPGEDPELDALGTDLRELWKLALDPGTLVANQTVAGTDDAAMSAQELYQTYRTVRSVVSNDLASRSDLTGAATDVLAQLPQQVMRQFLALAVTHADSDVFARDWLGGLSDTDLADRLMSWMNSGGPDAVDVAKRIVDHTQRQPALIALTAARMAADNLDPEGDAPTLPSLRSRAKAGEVRPEVADALGRRFLEARVRDLATLTAEIPDNDAARSHWDTAALRDYLRLEIAVEPMREVLERFRGAVRGALEAGRSDDVATYFDIMDESLQGRAPGPATDLLASAAQGTVTDDLIRGVVSRAREVHTLDRLGQLFERVAPQVIDGMVRALAEAEDPAERAALVTSLSTLAKGRAEAVLAHLDGQPWFVQRNLVAVLGRAGDRVVLPALVRASKAKEPQLRREAVRALLALLKSESVPHIAALMFDADESVRRAAIGTLAGMPTNAAAQAIARGIAARPDAPDIDHMIAGLANHLAPGLQEALEPLADRAVRKALPRHARKELGDLLKSHKVGR